MSKKIRWITETAVMLAMLVALQALTKPMGQYVTGSFVNAILAITVLLVGLSSGLTVALISPVMAFFLGIAPNIVTVIPIMIANVCYIVLLYILAGKRGTALWKKAVALVTASAAKFGILYLLVVKVICGIASGSLLDKKMGKTVLLAPKMLENLPLIFTWPQLFTALIGGAVALSIVPVLRKALKK